MIAAPETLHRHIVPRQSGRRYLRLAWASFIGLSLGLSVARLVYEADPFQFMVFGGLGPTAAAGVVGALIAVLLIWLADRQPGGLLPEAALLPVLLVWWYILTPPMQVDPLRGSVLISGALLVTLALAAPWMLASEGIIPPERRWVGTVAVGAIALAVYLITLQRTVGRADTFEFQVTAPVLGVAHPTGYPLYILLGKLFSLIPIGKVAARVNMTSVVAAALAVTFLYLTLRRVFFLDRFISGLSALAFGLSPIFWSQAVIAEVYALHNMLAAAVIGGTLWLVTRYQRGVLIDEPHLPLAVTREDSPYPARIVVLVLTVIGLSLTNHLTTVLLVPAVVVAFLFAWPRLTWQQWALAAGLMFSALLIYLYIPLRWPALHNGQLMRWDEFWAWVTGSRFEGALQLNTWLRDPDRWRIVARLIFAQYGWLGVLLSGIGLVLMALHRWQAALVSGLVFAAHFFYGLNYLVPDIAVFLIPMFFIQAMWMGYGVGVLIDWFVRRYPMSIEPWAHAALVTLFAILPLSAAWTTGATFDWSDELALEAWGRRVLNLPLEEGAAILADSEKVAPLEYLHRIEGIRPDIDVVVLGTEAEYAVDLQARIENGQAVYLARFLPGLEGFYSLRSMGPLVEVAREPISDIAGLDADPARWVNGITLVGAEIDQQHGRPGDELWVTLYWSTDRPLEDNFHVWVRLVDLGGQVFWQNVPAYPVGNRYPPVAWKSDEIIPDFYGIPLPYTLRPGSYTVEVALAPPFSPDIAALENGKLWRPVKTVVVEPTQGPVPVNGRRLAITFTEGALFGVDAEAQTPVGGNATLVATWRTGRLGLRTEYSLPHEDPQAEFPVIAQSSDLRLEARQRNDIVEWSIGGAPMRCGWMQPVSDSCPLARMRVEGEATAQAIANFENKLLLTEVEFEAGRLEPGQQVDVTLTWQALNEIDEDYTIFVHLLGPDGRLHGQIDAWPVQGTHPTSAWEIGEVVLDSYSVPLNFDAPPGSYQLEIGVYLLATNTRLRVLDAEAIPVDDRVLLGGLIVPEE